jgi:hypothetical protein
MCGDETSWTTLTFAAHNGREAVVQLLLERGNAGADMSLVFAAESGHEAVVRLLLEWNDVGREFSEALTFATEREHETVVRLLREYKERLSGVILLLNVHR